MCLNFCNLFPELYMDSQLPTERTIVCEDAIHNSFAFVHINFVFTIIFKHWFLAQNFELFFKQIVNFIFER